MPSYVSREVEPLKAYNLDLARKDINAFVEYVMVDQDRPGQPVKQSRVHVVWQALIDKHPMVSIMAPVGHGKSSGICSRILWEIGHNPDIRILVISKNEAQAKKLIALCQRYIEKSEEYRQVFPNVRPGSSAQDVWSSAALTVERDTPSANPTVQAFGLGGNPIGSRSDLIILDDLLTPDSTATPEERRKPMAVWENNLRTRFPVGAPHRAVSIGTPYHPEDFLHQLQRLKGWTCFRFSAIDKDTWDPATLLWPERLTVEQLKEIRDTSESDLAFARNYLCEARDEGSADFREADVRACRGRGYQHELVYEVLPWELSNLGPGHFIVTGVDLAVQKGKRNDQTAMVTILVYPEGDRQILDVVAGQWSASEIVDRIADLDRRYNPLFLVENNGSQEYLLQFTQQLTSASVIPFTTGRNKAHPEHGIMGLAREVADRRWIFPCESISGSTGNKHLDQLLTQMLYYRRGAHTGDLQMAMWFAREGARMVQRMGDGGASVYVIGDGARGRAREAREGRVLEALNYSATTRGCDD